MKKLLPFIIIFIFVSGKQSFGQQGINIDDYINMNHPVIKKYMEMDLQVNNQALAYMKMRNGSTQAERNEREAHLSQMRTELSPIYDAIQKIPVYVPDSKTAKALREAIYEETKTLQAELKKLSHQYIVNDHKYVNMGGDPRHIATTTGYIEHAAKHQRLYVLKMLVKNIKVGQTTVKPGTNSNNNLQQEFLAEIAKINAEITQINKLANNRNIIGSFAKSQKLCDRLRLLLGRQYFRITLQKIRKDNPGFSFSINPLSEKVTRDYWIRMRNRANIAYRNAMEAHRGCVYNEGIQTWTKVEIPLRFFKATFDLVTNTQDLFSGNLWGSLDAIRNSYGYQDDVVQLANTVGLEVFKAGEEAKDWKSYVGVVTGLMSAWDGYIKTYKLAVENHKQKDLLVANRETADQLINSNKKLLLEFDKYRAYIDANSSAIDCLNDKLMRIDFDNKTVTGDPKEITIWGTGLYDWDGEKFIEMIKESGEDLKNEYIYCQDFIKALQMAVDLADKDYIRTEEKLRNSGAIQSQIDAQLSYNRENADWFEGETQRLVEYYYQYCEKPESQPPEDVIIVSTEVIPGVEDQDVDPNKPDPWEAVYPEDEINEYSHNEPGNETGNDTPSGNYNSPSGNITSGNGWTIKQIQSTPDVIKNELAAETNAGRTPAGIYISDHSGAQVYYINDNSLGMTSWNLEWYNDGAALQNGITDYINNGYFPMGISFTDQGKLYVLYIQCQVKGNAWQLVESELDLNSVSQDLQSLISQNYIPVGITVYESMYYTLMVQISDAQMSNWTIEGYEESNITQNINAKIDQGMVPFGYLKEGSIVNVLYVGF